MVVPEVDVVRSVVGAAVAVVILRAAVGVGAGDVRRRILVAQRRAGRTRGVAVVEPEIVMIGYLDKCPLKLNCQEGQMLVFKELTWPLVQIEGQYI